MLTQRQMCHNATSLPRHMHIQGLRILTALAHQCSTNCKVPSQAVQVPCASIESLRTVCRYDMKFFRDSKKGLQKIARSDVETWYEHAQEVRC